MTILENPNDLNINAKVPSAICSMYDENLFIEITDLSEEFADGDFFAITVDGVVFNIIMWGGVGRLYFDNFYFDNFSDASKSVNITAPFSYQFRMIPKKSIGDISSLSVNKLPLWTGKNTFSYPTIFNLDTIDSEGNREVKSMPELQKNTIENIAAYYFTESGDTELHSDSPYSVVYAPQYRKEIPISGYFNICRLVCDNDIYFEWIDSEGFWRSWYFKLRETKISSKSDRKDVITNVNSNLNERTVQIDLKSNSITRIFSSGNEPRENLQTLNSIKQSSFVFMGEEIERVNIKSEETTDKNLIDEFIFSVTNETKPAI